jgi:small-conductance mechanosensitive channel
LSILAAGAVPWAGTVFPAGSVHVGVTVALTLLSAALAVVAVRAAAERTARLVGARGGGAAAGTVRVVLVSGGYVAVAVTALGLLAVPVERLLLSGAISGVILGIAGQQTLSNAFAGITLLFARPFTVGHQVSLRGGPLGGQYDGEVIAIGLMYTTLRTDQGLLNLPNSSVLAAVSGPRTAPDLGPGHQSAETSEDRPQRILSGRL